MTESPDLNSWSSFQLIEMRDVVEDNSNIYFLVATVVEKDKRIAGYSPGVVRSPMGKHASMGIHITWSNDGLHWEAPTNVYRVKGNGLYAIHPVGIFNGRLITQEPLAADSAFKISQKFRGLSEMNKTLTLTAMTDGPALMRAQVVYDMDLWNE